MNPIYGTNVFGANVVDCNCRCHHHQYQSNQVAALSFEDKLDAIDRRWDEAYTLFTKIYNELVESAEFKEWAEDTKKNRIIYKKALAAKNNLGEYSILTMNENIRAVNKEFYDIDNLLDARWSKLRSFASYHKYDTKIKLLRAYLGLDSDHDFPFEWYHHEEFKS